MVCDERDSVANHLLGLANDEAILDELADVLARVRHGNLANLLSVNGEDGEEDGRGVKRLTCTAFFLTRLGAINPKQKS